MEKEKERLFMPQGLNTNKEFMKGLEFKSLTTMFLIILILNIPNLVLTIILKKSAIFSIWYIMITGALSYMLVLKGSSNISTLDMIVFLIKFIKTQKKYEYILKDELR